jgi:hypothetical protein
MKTQFIDARRGDQGRFINIPAIGQPDPNLHVDLDALTFLLETEHRNLLGELMAVDQAFQSVIFIVNQRTTLHKDEPQPLLKSKMRQGVPHMATLAEMEALLGHSLVDHLRRLTDEMIERVDIFLEHTSDHALELRAALKQLYPHRVFIRFSPSVDGPTLPSDDGTSETR